MPPTPTADAFAGSSPPPIATRFAVILPAAGRSLRYGGAAGAGQSKLAEDLLGQSVLARSVGAFLGRPEVCQIVIATSDPAGVRALLPADWHPRLTLAPGGDCRAASVRSAVAHVMPDADYIAIHDAARPLVSQDLITRIFAAAIAHGAAAPATAVTQTIKQATGPLPARIEHTLARHTLWALQTPQVIRRDVLTAALAHAAAHHLDLTTVTDDLQLLELANIPAHLIPGEESNLKITFPPDLTLATALLQSQNAPGSIALAARARDNPPPATHS